MKRFYRLMIWLRNEINQIIVKYNVVSSTSGSGSLTVHSNLCFSGFPCRFLIALKSAPDH